MQISFSPNWRQAGSLHHLLQAWCSRSSALSWKGMEKRFISGVELQWPSFLHRMNLYIYNKSHTTKSCLNEGMSTLMWFVEIANEKNITPKIKDETVGSLCLFEHLYKKTVNSLGFLNQQMAQKSQPLNHETHNPRHPGRTCHNLCEEIVWENLIRRIPPAVFTACWVGFFFYGLLRFW